jgi:hypothetical protein
MMEVTHSDSQINDDANSDRRLLRRLFRSKIAPLAHRYRQQRRQLLDGNPQQDLPTYYHHRASTRMTKEEFETGSGRSVQELTAGMQAIWSEADDTDLQQLAPQFARLAEKLRSTQVETDDVSPFIYVMY